MAVPSGRPVRIAVTSGEPAGIGPELCAALSKRKLPGAVRLVVLGDRALLAERATCMDFQGRWVDYDPDREPEAEELEVLHVPLSLPSTAGQLAAGNGDCVLAILDRAIAGCQSGEFDAMVTAPLHKGVINDGGRRFSGHTEYLAEQTGTARVVMMLVGGGLRVALATTHVPLKRVPEVLTESELLATLRILDEDLRARFGLPRPRILVAGLNPHAGESGHMGREEIEVIIPALEVARAEGIDAIGPLPADTMFTPHQLERGDAVLAMYHDQGLPVLKYASFGGGVNVTLGLPIIRTSVDHGTALDLAGTGQANPGSLYAAVELARAMAAQRRESQNSRVTPRPR